MNAHMRSVIDTQKLLTQKASDANEFIHYVTIRVEGEAVTLPVRGTNKGDCDECGKRCCETCWEGEFAPAAIKKFRKLLKGEENL